MCSSEFFLSDPIKNWLHDNACEIFIRRAMIFYQVKNNTNVRGVHVISSSLYSLFANETKHILYV